MTKFSIFNNKDLDITVAIEEDNEFYLKNHENLKESNYRCLSQHIEAINEKSAISTFDNNNYLNELKEYSHTILFESIIYILTLIVFFVAGYFSMK